MVYPAIGSNGFTSVGHTSPTGSGTTSTLTVHSGDSIYVFIGYAAIVSGNNVSVTGVSDGSGNTYKRAAGIRNVGTSIYPAIDVWYVDNVPANSSIQVTVTFSHNTFFTVSAIEVTGSNPGGSLDGATVGVVGASFPTSSPSSMDPITTVNPNDLVIACVCFQRGVGTVSSGGGFTLSSAIDVIGPGSGDTGIEGFYDDVASPGSVDSKLHGTTSGFPYAVCTVAIRLAFGVSEWSGLSGRPYLSVSAKGIANSLSLIFNDGADFGPDTPGTSTSGIQEALNFLTAGGTVHCRNGAYSVSSPLINTSSNQDVIFEPGAVITFASGTTPLTSNWGRAALIVVGTNNGTSPATYVNYSHCRWIGYGVTINASLAGASAGNGGAAVFGVLQAGLVEGTSITPGEDIEIAGFTLQNVPSTAVIIAVENYTNITALSHPVYSYQIGNVRVSRITANWPVSGTGSVFGLVVSGSARAVAFEDCVMDASQVGSANARSVLFIDASAGEAQEIRVSRCTFKCGQVGNSFELQGNTYVVGTSAQKKSLHEVLIEDCIFDSGASTVKYSGGGGGLIDDNGATPVANTPGYVYNVEFRRCYFVNAGVTTKTQGDGTSQFGYLRFTDGSAPGGFAGTPLLGRGPADPGITPTVTSGVNVTNTYGFPVRLIVNPNTATGLSVSINSISAGSSGGTFVIREGDTYNISWSTGTPTVTVQAL